MVIFELVVMCDKESTSSINRNVRTHFEETKLVECLLELVHGGEWRGDNETFRTGYLQQLERCMNEKIPSCNLKATPELESRVRILKKQYNAIS